MLSIIDFITDEEDALPKAILKCGDPHSFLDLYVNDPLEFVLASGQVAHDLFWPAAYRVNSNFSINPFNFTAS